MGNYEKSKRLLVLSLILFTLGGCGSLTDLRSFTSREADFSFYHRVGVLQFKNQSEDRLAAEKVTEHFMTELLIAGQLEVMDLGQFNTVVAQVAKANVPVSALELSPQQLTQIAEAAKVQGIFTGVVHDYTMVQVAGEQYPMISMTVKFIDAPTGTVAWQASVTSTGGPYMPIVSYGEIFTLGELTQTVCADVVKDFYRHAFAK